MLPNGWCVAQDYKQAVMWLYLATARAADAAIRDGAAQARDSLAVKMPPVSGRRGAADGARMGIITYTQHGLF